MKTNSTPFSAKIQLITETHGTTADGYQVTKEKKRTVWASVNIGADRREFYLAYQAGSRISLTVEVWELEYKGENLIEYDGKRYNVVRAYPTGRDTLELSCTEAV